MKTSEDPKVVYADIINHPHHRSETRPHMSLYDRAAQFSAFDALSGYSDMISEEARLTDSKIELDENEKEILNQKLSLIADVIEDGQKPSITFTIFVPDQFKAGGKYETITETVKCVDLISQRIVLEKRKPSGINNTLEIHQILAIGGELIDSIGDFSISI